MQRGIALGLLLTCGILASAQTADVPIPKGTNYVFSVQSSLGLGYQYKHQCGEKLWWRAGVNLNQVSLQQSINPIGSSKMLIVGAGVITGLEWRKPMNESLIFFHGPELGASDQGYFYLGSPGSRPLHYMGLSVSYQLGVMAQLTPHLGISGELNPGVTYTTSLSSFETADQFSLGSTSGLCKISLVIIR